VERRASWADTYLRDGWNARVLLGRRQ